MKILKIDHLGIAVNRIDEGKQFWRDVLGLKFEKAENRGRKKKNCIFAPKINRRCLG